MELNKIVHTKAQMDAGAFLNELEHSIVLLMAKHGLNSIGLNSILDIDEIRNKQYDNIVNVLVEKHNKTLSQTIEQLLSNY